VSAAAFDELRAAAARDDHEGVLRLSAEVLDLRPGDDATHELRARSLLALGRLDEAERHASDAVRLDPDETRYRELLAEILVARGAHADAATEYHDLSVGDPAQAAWTAAEARARLEAAQFDRAVELARDAVRLDPTDADAQLTLARGLVRQGDGAGAITAAQAALGRRHGDPAGREVLADARWLVGLRAAAFEELRALSIELGGEDRERVTEKARALYRQRAGRLGRWLVGIAPLFAALLRAGRLHVR
jgi:predicted Zn-dependent protease